VKAAALALSVLIGAPLQCSHDPDPSLRQEDTAGDALWELAHDFKDGGEDTAYRHTLETLVSRYPSNRHAPAAREELDGGAR
jgi:hypothetical protein